MFEDPDMYTMEAKNLKYLLPIVMHNSLDKHYYISLLFRIQSIGIHYVLCEKLKHMDIRDEIPQLIEIMLRGPEGTPISQPVYKLLLFKAKMNLYFRIDLFLRLKSVLSTIDETKASHCYFLCCDILDIDKSEHQRNLKTLSNRLRNRRKLRTKYLESSGKDFRSKYFLPTRTFSVRIGYKSPSFHGVMLFFAKALTAIFNTHLFSDLDRYSKVFNTRKNFKSLQIKSNRTKFQANIRFLEAMINISNRLKKMPTHLRRRALVAELEMLNHEVCNKILNPFDNRRTIVNFVLDHAKVLDSAENCPYLVLVESAYQSSRLDTQDEARFRKAKVLVNQLESLSELDDLGDVDGIKESILNAMENILFESQTSGTQSDQKCISNTDIPAMTKNAEIMARSTGSLNTVLGDKDNKMESIEEPLEGLSIGNTCQVPDRSVLNFKLDNVPISLLSSSRMSQDYESLRRAFFDDNLFLANKATDISQIDAHTKKDTNQNDSSKVDIKPSDSSNNPTPAREASPAHDTLISNEEFDEFVSKSSHQYELLAASVNSHLGNFSEEQNDYSNYLAIYENIYNCDEPGFPPIIKDSCKSLKHIKNELSKTSKFSGLPGWDLKSFIIKSGGVIKHEYIAYQILTQIKEIFMIEKLPIYIRNYKIILISDTSGLIETVQDAISIHRIKADAKFKSLSDYFKDNFLGDNLVKAKNNFLYSLAGYSLASYLLQIKDRHNGNILIDSHGHIIHVDFGYIFGKYPGILSLENAPFKFSTDYLELIDIEHFKNIFIRGFKILRKHKEKLVRLVEIMEDTGYCDKFTFSAFLDRLKMEVSERDIETYCQWMIAKSTRNIGTAFYDQIQYFSNGYL